MARKKWRQNRNYAHVHFRIQSDTKIFVSAKKYLRKKKFPDTCGHGLRASRRCRWRRRPYSVLFFLEASSTKKFVCFCWEPWYRNELKYLETTNQTVWSKKTTNRIMTLMMWGNPSREYETARDVYKDIDQYGIHYSSEVRGYYGSLCKSSSGK